MIVLYARVEILIQLRLHCTVFHHWGINNPVAGTQEVILEISQRGSEPVMPQAEETQQLQIQWKVFRLISNVTEFQHRSSPLRAWEKYTALSSRVLCFKVKWMLMSLCEWVKSEKKKKMAEVEVHIIT